MKTLILLILLSFNLPSWAQAEDKLNLQDLCQGKLIFSQKMLIADNGFCEEYLKLEMSSVIQTTDKGIGLNADPCYDFSPNKDKWKIRLYMSHSFTTYFDTDVTFSSSRYNVTIKDYSWAERSSREFFEPKTWKEPGNNPLQVIDEPTNTFVVSLEKNGHEFFLSAFHPKFLQAPDQVKHIKGTIDGTPVDAVAPVNKPFDGYDQVAGESELVRNENSHRQMTFEIGYAHRFKLLDSRIGNITYVPGLALGTMVGNNYTVMIKENEWWEFDDHQDKYGIQGFGGSLTNRIELNTKKERFGLFYENKLSYYRQKHGFLVGSQKYNLMFMGNSFGMKFMIYNPNNHPKKLPSDS